MTAFKAGTRLTAGGLSAAIQIDAYRTSNGTAMTNNTLANEPVLFVPLTASVNWHFECELVYNGAATNTGDLKFAFTVPSGATLYGQALTVSNPLGLATNYFTTGSLVSYSNGTGNPLVCWMKGTIIMGVTAGNLQLQAAENTTNATGTTIMTGSSLRAWQL